MHTYLLVVLLYILTGLAITHGKYAAAVFCCLAIAFTLYHA